MATLRKAVGRPRKAVARWQKGTVTEKRRALIDAMVWGALPIDEAAARAGLAPISARQALRCPAVLEAFEAERKALLAGERPRNIHALTRVRDKSDNGVAVVGAVKALESMIEDAGLSAPAGGARPGIVIQISPAYAPAAGGPPRPSGGGLVIDAQPLPTDTRS